MKLVCLHQEMTIHKPYKVNMGELFNICCLKDERIILGVCTEPDHWKMHISGCYTTDKKVYDANREYLEINHLSIGEFERWMGMSIQPNTSPPWSLSSVRCRYLLVLIQR